VSPLLPQPGAFEGLSRVEDGSDADRLSTLDLDQDGPGRVKADPTLLPPSADATDSEESIIEVCGPGDGDVVLGEGLVFLPGGTGPRA
jgi:hypothetical protein